MSNNKFLFFAFSVFLTICMIEAFPRKADLTTSEEHTLQMITESDEVESSEVTEKLQLLIFALKEIMLVHDVAIVNSMKLFNDVLKDMDKLKDKSDELKSNITEISSLVEQYDSEFKAKPKDYKSFDKYLDYSGRVSDIINQFDEDETEKKHTPLEESFYKNGLSELQIDVVKEFADFFHKIIVKTDNFIATLSEKEKEEEEKLIDWLKQFKSESIAKKMNDFETYFNIVK